MSVFGAQSRHFQDTIPNPTPSVLLTSSYSSVWIIGPAGLRTPAAGKPNSDLECLVLDRLSRFTHIRPWSTPSYCIVGTGSASSLFSYGIQNRYAAEDGAESRSSRHPALRTGKFPTSQFTPAQRANRMLTNPATSTGLFKLFKVQMQMCLKAWRSGLREMPPP